MLDIKVIRENPEQVKKALKKKHVDVTAIDNLLELDKEMRAMTKEVEDLQAKKNKASKEMPKLSGKEKEATLKEMQFVKERIAEIDPKIKKLDVEITALLSAIPNPPLPSVIEGAGDQDNKPFKTVGKKPDFQFEILDHMALGRKNNMIDTESAAAMSGTRFYYLKNQAVMLEFALVQFVMKKLISKGFTPVIPPVLVKENAMFGTGFFPADRNEIYHVNPEDDDVYLVGTAEVPLAMLYAGKILAEEELPKRFVGFSTCFRREAGSYGKDTHGIFRVHQFDKLEMFSFCHPDKSEEEHEFILSIEEEIMSELGLHYQVVNICGGDLGAPAAKKYDIETWIPSQGKYRELTSCSNCTDFQARRCNIRYKDEKGANHILHTLNGTACAMARMLVAIMENYQRPDGTIAVPEVLKKWM
jgi:seryl-tRNA synthetase